MITKKLDKLLFYGESIDQDSYSINVIEKIKILLFYLLPITLISGPFLSDLSVSIIGILFLVNVFKKKDFTYFKNYFSIFFSIFYVILLISSITSSNPLFSLESTLFYFRFGLFSLATYYILNTSVVFIRNLFFIMTMTFSFLIIDGYIQLFFGQNILGYTYDGSRLSSFFGNELILGSYLSRLIPILFALMIATNSNSKTYLISCMTLLILSDILILVSGERTALFNFLLSSIIIIVFIEKWKLIRLSTVIISLIIMIIIIFVDDKIHERIITNTLTQTNILNVDDNKNISKDDGIFIFSAQHESHYIAAIEMFKDNPLIGIGPKLFRLKCNEYDDKSYESKHGNKLACSTHPHNIYIQLLAETGIIGFSMIFLCFIFVIVTLIIHLFSKIKYKQNFITDFQVCLFAAIIISLWPIIPSNNFFNNWINIIFYFPVGFLIYSYDKTYNKLKK